VSAEGALRGSRLFGSIPAEIVAPLARVAARKHHNASLVEHTRALQQVGATLETTIRTTSRWKKQGMVETLPDGFVVRDLEALHALAAGADRR
jgi:hypothetical protein